MRFILAGFGAVLLGGCGGELGNSMTEGFNKGFKESFVKQCAEGATNAAAARLGPKDFTVACTCTVEELMKKKSATEIATAKPDDPVVKATTEQCFRTNPPK